MRVEIFKKEQIKDLQYCLDRYYESYEDIHKFFVKDKDLSKIDAMTVDSILLSLDNALREIRCLRKELWTTGTDSVELERVDWDIEASPEEIEDVLNDMD